MVPTVKAIEGFLAAGDLAQASVALNHFYEQWDQLTPDVQIAIKTLEPIYLSLISLQQGGAV
ncbi:MAG: hypothetical protein NDJ24_03825 [Alphaproteobacteria bacterium]|nr:hypothetical protein [Alphaproteobacteria bacterium]